MAKLADTFATYVRAKVDAGADVIQLFDSWVGALSVADYEEFVAPYSARILSAVDVPTIHFGTGTTHLLPSMARAGGDVIGLDWRVPLDEGWELVGDDRGVQGNLDPALLLGPWERSTRARATCSTAPAAGPGTSSTSATASSRTPTPRCSAGFTRARARGDDGGARLSAAVVLMAYGSPERLDDVPAYYADIRGGRPIPSERLEDLVERYRRLGIEDGVAAERDHRGDARCARARARRPVFTGHEALDAAHRRRGRARARAGRRHDRRPRARAALLAALDRGYRRQVEEALADRAELAVRRAVGDGAGFVDAARRPVRGPTRTSSSPRTASPSRGPATTRSELLETSRLVAERAARRLVVLVPVRVADRRAVARPRHPRPPERRLRGAGAERVLVCPVGFVADHLEIRWDLDVEAADRARELGLEFARIEMPNADPRFVDVLAGLVRRALAVPSRA